MHLCNPARNTSPPAPSCAIWLTEKQNFTRISDDIMIATKPPPTEPRSKAPLEEPDSVIDTSKMSSGQRAALELTESAREIAQEPSFVSGLFMGTYDLSRIRPCPVQTAEDRDQGDAVLEKLET